MNSAVHLTAREDGERGGYPDNPRPPRRNDDGFPGLGFDLTQPNAAPASGGVVKTGNQVSASGAVSLLTAPPPPETGGHLGAGLVPPDGPAPLSFQLAEMRAERLCLLTDIHKAARGHKATAGLKARLKAVTARLAAMEGVR